MNVLPKGYKLVRDEALGDYVAPAGYRPEPIEAPELPVGRNRKRRERYERRKEALAALAASAEVAPGTCVPVCGSDCMPRVVAARVAAPGVNKLWLWIASRGCLIRLADAPAPDGVDPWTLAPGEFVVDEVRSRDEGFACYEHAGWGGFVKVRLPDDAPPFLSDLSAARSRKA